MLQIIQHVTVQGLGMHQDDQAFLSAVRRVYSTAEGVALWLPPDLHAGDLSLCSSALGCGTDNQSKVR